MSDPIPTSRETGTFSADESILGFKYQLRYALYLLFAALRTHGLDVEIDIERIDDIDVIASNRITKLVQTKRTVAVLTNSSAPFWKTIRIWADAIRTNKVSLDEIEEFRLVATSDPPQGDDTIVSQLSNPDDRTAIATALNTMRTLAESKRDQLTLGRAYREFHELLPEQQAALVEKIRIVTNAPSFDKLDRLIRDQIVHGPPDKREAFSRVLFGRWEMLVEDYLRSSDKPRIIWDQVQSLLHEISLQFTESNLPSTFVDMVSGILPEPTDDDRTFVMQLREIHATDAQIRRAQKDHLRSSQLTSFWLRYLLVRPDEIMTHSVRLIDECGNRHEFEVSENCNDDQLVQIGKSVHEWAMTIAPTIETMRLRKNFDDMPVIRGKFHDLADHPKLGWHPKWETKFPNSH